MILDRELTAAERLFSQKILRNYWVFTSLGMACCGDAVLPLLGIRIGLPDAVLSTLGAMNYACFLMLPLGFFLGGRFGAGKSMAQGNIVMAVSVLLITSSLFLGSWAFFAGLMLFLVGRATNFAMRFTLQKNIALETEMSAMLARNYIGMSTASLLGGLAVAFIFSLLPGKGGIGLVLLAGAALFGMVAWCINRVKEPFLVRKLAAQPLGRQIRKAWRNPVMRHQIYVGVLLNCFQAAVLPVSIIAAKKGVNISNAATVLLTAAQAFFAVFSSLVVKEITQRSDPRKMMLISYPLVWVLCGCWCFLPMRENPWLLLLVFMLGGMILISLSTSMENYFLISVPVNLQMGGTFLVFVVTGGLAGTLGMLLNSLVFKAAGFFIAENSDPLSIYRFYFFIMLVLFAGGIFGPWSLPSKKKLEQLKNKSN